MTYIQLISLPNGKTVGTINENEAAAYLSVAVQTLQKWRSSGGGPPYAKIGRRVVYRLTDLERWLESRLIDGEDRS